MAGKSIFRSFTLPNGTVMKTMRKEVRDSALQAVTDRRSGVSDRKGATSAPAKKDVREYPKQPA